MLINAIEQSARELQQKEKTSVKPAGADDLLPVLIFVLIQVNPPNLHSNLEYISNFHLQLETEGGEGLYYLTTVKSAVEFLRYMDHSAVSNVSKAEFEFNCADILRPLGLEMELEPGEPGYVEPGAPPSASGTSGNNNGKSKNSNSKTRTKSGGGEKDHLRDSKSSGGSKQESGHSTPTSAPGGGAAMLEKGENTSSSSAGAGASSSSTSASASASSTSSFSGGAAPASASANSAASVSLADAEKEIAQRHLIFPLDKDRRLMLREFEHHFKAHKMDTLTIREVPQLLSDYKALSRFFQLLQESYYEQEKKFHGA